MITTAHHIQRRTTVLAATLAALLAVAGSGLAASSATAAETTVIVVPAPFNHTLSISKESRFSDTPLLVPRSATRVTFELPDADVVLDQLHYLVYGADFEATGVAALDPGAHTASIDLPADFFEIRDGHAPLKQVDFRQDATGELVGTPTADDYYGITLTGSGPLADPNPFFVEEYVGPADQRSSFRASLVVQATAPAEQAHAVIDLTSPTLPDDDSSFFHLDWRSAPGVHTISVGDTVTFRAEAGFWLDRLRGTQGISPIAVLAYSEELDNAGEIALATTLSADGRDLTVTIPAAVSTYQYGAEPRIEVVMPEGVESDGFVAFLVPVAIAGTPALPVAPGRPVAVAGVGSISLEWQQAQVISQQTEYLVQVYEDGLPTKQIRTGSAIFGTATLADPTPGVEYTFDVAGINQNGAGPASPRSAPITLTDDSTAPTVIATTPASGARSVDVTAPIAVQLSEPVLFPSERPRLTLRRAGVVTQVPFVGLRLRHPHAHVRPR